MSILRKRLRNRVCPNRIRPTNRTAKAQPPPRIPEYMMVFQFSPVIIWKTVTNPQVKVSKLARGMQSCRSFQTRPSVFGHHGTQLPSTSMLFVLANASGGTFGSSKWNLLLKKVIIISVQMYSTRRKSTDQYFKAFAVPHIAFSRTPRAGCFLAIFISTRNSLNVRSMDRFMMGKILPMTARITTKPSNAVKGFVQYPFGPRANNSSTISAQKTTRNTCSRICFGVSTPRLGGYVSSIMTITFATMTMRIMSWKFLFWVIRFATRTVAQSMHSSCCASSEWSELKVGRRFAPSCVSSFSPSSSSTSSSSSNDSNASSTTASATLSSRKEVTITIMMK
mmetsp:Transcript_35025/g.89982  ORF Transcript_35025/g.89982 Transcript_35025/m.89982 type:complete len:337 (-) Transcript_35025:1442-2452(-)